MPDAVKIQMAEGTVKLSLKSDQEIIEEMRECYDLVLKAARRCTRDLRHAIDNITDLSLKEMFRQRAEFYETVLGGTSDYRTQLHRQIEILEAKIRGETF